jgi:hypothetical protein
MTEPCFGTPNEPYEPPPNQPDQPPPDEPERLRQSRLWWISGAALIVLVAGVTVLFILARTGGSSSSNSYPDRSGQRAVDVVHELHICDNPQVDQGFATRTLQDLTGYAIVATMDDKAELDRYAAEAKNPEDGCTMVVKG